jgi:alanine dehydrogenase
VRETITMADAIESLRTANGAFAAGEIVESPRVNLMIPTGFLRLMAASWPNQKLVGYKEFHRCNGLVRFAYHLYDMESGEPLAIVDANHLTALRTGACGGLAADLLAAQDADVLAVIGTGNEARSQVDAVCAVRGIRRVQAFGRDPERRKAFCAEIEERHDVEAIPMIDGRGALAGAQIIAVATNTGTTGPAFFGEWIGDDPVHINSIGSTIPRQREIDEHVWKHVERIVIDAALLLEESGDALEARRHGTIDESKIALLGDVIAGTSEGRTDPSQRTLYKSVGSALQDLTVAAFVYRQVSSRGTPCLELAPFQEIATMQE